MSEEKERFGRYLILDHLVDGGMAKICRARFLGEQADKVVAIKMIQPQYSSDESFKTMFMDEIKVTFGLLHPNIVQTYDYGLHKEQLFVAMEYCDGRNLKEYLDRLRQKKFVFPVEISIYIISQVCQGLNYSHTFTDKLTGKAANIIHRDISPHNIMLTYDGAVKIIDFGIAKANTNSEATQAGTIKGKLSYLAPEYLDGLALDARYDMFAVGITLWEMLCSRKLFKAANDLAVLKKIQECKIPPPSKINPNVPKELDDIVLQALRKDRNKRFENMDQFNRALIKFLYANYPDFNSSDLSYFAKELFKEEIKKDREKLFEFGKIDIKAYLADWKDEQEGGTNRNKDKGSEAMSAAGSDKENRKQEAVLDFGFEDEAPTKTSLKNRKTRATSTKGASRSIKKDSSIKVIDGENLKITAPPTKKKSVSMGRPANSEGTKTRSRKRKGKTQTQTGVLSIDTNKHKNLSLIFVLTASLVVGAYFGKEHIPFLNAFFSSRDPASEKLVVKQLPKEDELNSGLNKVNDQLKNGIRLANYDPQVHKVFIDGNEEKPNFLKKVSVKVNKPFFLRVERPGFKPFVKEYNLQGGDMVTVEIPAMPQTSFGYLYLSRGCQMYGTVSFELYGESRIERVPMINPIGIAFPVKGDGRVPADASGRAMYEVYFKKTNENISRKISFSFESDEQRIDICDL
ncbi:MAG: serine/threonine protein kinase [Bacteriovoracaceae bacterium]|nr:serine/threonine protein kinase [Bacteriovoracaceae bacterium]